MTLSALNILKELNIKSNVLGNFFKSTEHYQLFNGKCFINKTTFHKMICFTYIATFSESSNTE